MRKVLCRLYRFPPQAVVEMTYEQQEALLSQADTLTFSTMEDYQRWLQENPPSP